MRSLPVICLLAALAPALVLAACPYHTQAGALDTSLEATGQRAVLGKDWQSAVDSLDVQAVKKDIYKIATKSQAFWPADFGYYGGFFIRLAWHCSGSYRKSDGRGGCDGGRIRFSPEGAWPDNGNLEKAIKLLEPVKKKYGDSLSWGDLIILAGIASVEYGGGPKLPFCAGRIDDKDGSASVELGPGKEQDAVMPCKDDGDCKYPLGPTTLGLIYVNPQGPKGVPKPELSVHQVRATFHGNMGFTDEETVAIIGGGHAFGKAHGACAKANNGACTSPLEGIVPKTLTSGFEGPWTTNPTRWGNEYFQNLLDFEYKLTTSPAGHKQWVPSKRKNGKGPLPKITMLTADLSLLHDPIYLSYVKLFAKDLKALEKAFAKAWFKLTTHDMGPSSRCLGKLVPPPQPWQCDVPKAPKVKVDYAQVGTALKKALGQDSVALFSALAFQSAATFRSTDHRGGIDGARIRLAPEKDFPANKGLDKVLSSLEPIKSKHPISWADLIALAGTVAIEQATGKQLKFCGGRGDAKSGCDELLPRTYYPTAVAEVKDSAKILGLSLREYVALTARPRSAELLKLQGYSAGSSSSVVSSAFFKELLGEKWVKSKSAKGKTEYKSGDKYILPTSYALVQDAELKAIAKEFAASSSALLDAFVSGWSKLVNAGRYSGPDPYVC